MANESDFSAAVDERLYREALSRGLDHRLRKGEPEHLSRPVELLATATQLTPALLVSTPASMHRWSLHRDESREALERSRVTSAGLVRLAHWAREVHARDVGYETGAWVEQAISLGRELVENEQHNRALALDHLEEAGTHLANAIVALHGDRLTVADSITQAQGAWLAAFARARSALRQPRTGRWTR